MTDPKKKCYRKFRRADADEQRLLVTTRQEFSLGLPTGGSLVCRLERGAGRVISFYVGYYEALPSLPMTTASMTKMSFRMFADFGAYLIRHPDKADLIPKGANVVFFTSKSPAFTAWSEAHAADLKRRRQKVVTARQVGRTWRIASL